MFDEIFFAHNWLSSQCILSDVFELLIIINDTIFQIIFKCKVDLYLIEIRLPYNLYIFAPFDAFTIVTIVLLYIVNV